MTAFVVDASVTFAWCFEDEATDASDELLGQLIEQGAWVPSLWHQEIANVLLVAERRGRISEADATRFTTLLAQLPIETSTDIPSIESTTTLGRQHGLTAYDATYLMLALRRGLPLATLDAGLREACAEAGVVVLPN